MSDDSDKVFDYVVVGTGILSAVSYKTLTDKKLSTKVINVEGLPKLQNHKDNKFNFEKNTIFYGLGGTSNIWASTYDFYPKAYNLPYLDKLYTEKNLKLVESTLKFFNVPIAELQNKHFKDKSYFFVNIPKQNINLAIRNRKLFKFKDIFNKMDLININFKNLKIDPINKLIQDKYSNKVIRYKKIILAAGGIGNPFLIDKYFTKNKSNGKNYMNHLKFSPLVFETKKYLRTNKVTGLKKNKDFEFIPTYLVKNSSKGLIHSFRIYVALRSDVYPKSNPLIKAIDKIIRKFGYSKFFKILIYTDMKPATNFLQFENDNIILNTSLDSTMNLVVSSISDIHDLLKSHLKIKNVFNKKDYIIREGSHHMGTTIMGKNSDEAVVDQNLNLFGFKDVKVVGTSSLPLAGSGHPTLTSMIVAILELKGDI